ncbi:MAG: DUF1080 domain-containing protein [Bryobacteraceae bacterium]
MPRTWLLLLVAVSLQGAGWRDLFNGRDLTGWESRGSGIWNVIDGGILIGQRDPRNDGPPAFPLEKRQYERWLNKQAWLYSTEEFREYDLSLEYWLRAGGNSGISLHDPGRAEHAISSPPDYTKTPARIAYEIQLSNGYPDHNPTGSIYNLGQAKIGPQKDNQWNRLDIEVRAGLIRVKLNGVQVAEAPPDPKRASRGPIGLQLHDMFTVVQFRNIRIRPLP